MLFADVSGSTQLYETAGDVAALDAIGLCIGRLSQAAESTGGRVLKTMGDEVMVLFPTADAAANGASEMHAAVDTLPPVNGTKLGVRIGFHSGPVIQRDNDVFGDTVNLAARLVDQAQKGQIVTSRETVQQLSPALRATSRRLYSITVIGRDASCGLVIAGENVSRLHCTIVRHHDRVVLRDHSTNGTFVTIDGDAEILLQDEDMPLHRHGWLALGEPRAETAEVVAYFVD